MKKKSLKSTKILKTLISITFASCLILFASTKNTEAACMDRGMPFVNSQNTTATYPGKCSQSNIAIDDITGPSQSFLYDFGEYVNYMLLTDGKISHYSVYASGILNDGTIIYAIKGYKCIIIHPSGVLTEACWGNTITPIASYTKYSFAPAYNEGR